MKTMKRKELIKVVKEKLGYPISDNRLLNIILFIEKHYHEQLFKRK